MTTPQLLIDGAGLSYQDLLAVAAGPVHLTLAPAAIERMARAHDAAVRSRQSDRTRTAGAKTSAWPSVTADSQAALRSFAVADGRPRSTASVRLMLVIRLNQLCGVSAGIRPAVAHALAEMINRDELPLIGAAEPIASADQSALATTALVLQDLSLDPTASSHELVFGPYDAEPFLQSSAATTAEIALAEPGIRRCAGAAMAVAALSCIAVRGDVEAYSIEVERAATAAGARAACRTMRSYLGAQPAGDVAQRHGLRAMPQAHGALLDALESARSAVTISANTSDADGDRLARAWDGLVRATARASELSFRRLSYACGAYQDETSGLAGLEMAQYLAAAAVGELSRPSGSSGATPQRVVELYEQVTVCELLVAVRAIRRAKPSLTALQQILLGHCENLPDELYDWDLTTEIEFARQLLPELGHLTGLVRCCVDAQSGWSAS